MRKSILPILLTVTLLAAAMKCQRPVVDCPKGSASCIAQRDGSAKVYACVRSLYVVNNDGSVTCDFNTDVSALNCLIWRRSLRKPD